MAAKNQPSTQPQQALAKTDETPSALVTSATDALAGIADGLDFGTDGLDEVTQEDVKIAVKVFNFKGVDTATNEPIQPNVFYDTLTEEQSKTLELILLTFHKSNEFREFDEQQNKSFVRCRSYDRVTGTMEDGTTRACDGCPDAEWRRVNDKPVKNCGVVHNVVGVDRLTKSALIIRFKKTSIDPWKTHLNKHFLGKRIVSGKRMNYPLFAFVTKISLKMERKGSTSWAVPVFESLGTVTREEIQQAGLDAMFYREHMMPAIEKAEREDAEAPPADSSFDFGANGAGDRDVFDVPGETVPAANGF